VHVRVGPEHHRAAEARDVAAHFPIDADAASERDGRVDDLVRADDDAVAEPDTLVGERDRRGTEQERAEPTRMTSLLRRGAPRDGEAPGDLKPYDRVRAVFRPSSRPLPERAEMLTCISRRRSMRSPREVKRVQITPRRPSTRSPSRLRAGEPDARTGGAGPSCTPMIRVMRPQRGGRGARRVR
jgi:hypothetical protein